MRHMTGGAVAHYTLHTHPCLIEFPAFGSCAYLIGSFMRLLRPLDRIFNLTGLPKAFDIFEDSRQFFSVLYRSIVHFSFDVLAQTADRCARRLHPALELLLIL